MGFIKSVRGYMPIWGKDCFIAENATIVGDVVMGDACSVWFNTVIRGDVNSIRIGNRVNIQDAAIIHCTYEQAAVEIGDHVSIGHRAIVHGCKIHANVLIGMGAIVMDHCEIFSGSIIAAGAVLTERSIVEPGWIWAGVPARPIKRISEDLLKGQVERISKNYTLYASWFKE